MSGFSNLYPITKTRNVIDNNGQSLTEILAGLQVDSGLIENATGDSKNIKGEYIKLPTGFFVFYYPRIELEIVGQPLYHRGTVHFPFEVDEDKYAVNITLETGDVSQADIHSVYVRNRYNDRVQISSINEKEQNEKDTITCSVIIVGRV